MNIITESTSKKMWISFEYKDVTYYYRFKYGRSYSNVEKYFKHDKNQFSIVTAGDFRIISKRIDKMNKKNRDIIYTSGWIITKLNPASNEYKKKIKSIKSSIKKKKSVAKDRNANVDQKIEKATISNVKAEITESGNNLIVNYKDNNEDKKVTFSFSKVDSDDAYEKLYSIKTELHPYTEEYFDFLKDTLDKTKYNSQQDRDSEKTRSFTTSFEPDIILGDKFPFHRRFISYLADGINLYNPDDMDNTKIEIKREIDKIEKYFKELKNKIKGEELDDDAELADDEFEAEESFKLLSDLYDKSFIDIKFKDKLTNIGFDSLLSMEKEPCNKYDSKAIKIIYNNNLIGYVPNQEEVKKICEDNINDNLKIINIKRESDNRNIGIRVIPEKYYTDDLRDNSIF